MTSVPTLEDALAALHDGCGVVDRSERGKLALTGSAAKEFLQGQVTNDVVGLTPGSGVYAAFLTPKGKMLGDLRILDAGEELLLDTERAALQELFNLIRRFSIGYDVQLHKRTLERGLLSLIGPRAGALSGADAAGVGEAEHAHRPVEVGGIAARAIRTDLGIDLLVDATSTEALAAALADAGAVVVSEAAGEVRRIESGRPRYGIDLDSSVIPQEAGLNERAVSFTKGCYVGQETVARLFYKGKPNRHLRGLRSERPLPVGAELRYEERPAGRVTSAAFSPRFGEIGLGFVRREVPLGARVALVNGDGTDAVPGDSAAADAAVDAEVVALPFA